MSYNFFPFSSLLYPRSPTLIFFLVVTGLSQKPGDRFLGLRWGRCTRGTLIHYDGGQSYENSLDLMIRGQD